MTTEQTVTEEGLRKLKEELDYLKVEKRKENVEAIRTALSFGDISENSEYDEAKNEQAKTESRIVELEETIRRVKVVADSEVQTDYVGVGSIVKVYDCEFNEEIEYTIVGSTEANPAENKISDLSPIGKALIGHMSGDTVEAITPGGTIKLKIMEIARHQAHKEENHGRQ
ncbi:MAG: transcription elongation factor GreA [Clostridia bacterium]|nr:transcription elongation factor GreA [Clostridia bacterium]